MYVEWKTTPVTSADHELSYTKNYEKKCGMPDWKQKYNILIECSLHKNKCEMTATINYSGPVLSDQKVITNSFNVYFASIGD